MIAVAQQRKPVDEPNSDVRHEAMPDTPGGQRRPAPATGRLGAPLVYATADAGRSWHELRIPTTADQKFGIQVLDRNHGTLQMGHGLYATSDGGQTWRRVPLPPGESFGLGARFLSPSLGWYLNLAVYPDQTQQPTAMWWTSDGGASWSELWRVDAQHPQASGVPLDGIKYVLGFRDASTGWLGVHQGNSHRLLATSDGGHVGLRWLCSCPRRPRLRTSRNGPFGDVHVLHTTDSGAYWTLVGIMGLGTGA